MSDADVVVVLVMLGGGRNVVGCASAKTCVFCLKYSMQLVLAHMVSFTV